ncbi:MAG: recombinase family protein [Sphingomonadales bacterium]|nr:recombinase family protein [Sphingomonadales bacterium]MBU3991642.1 recombinase family protein [Alphaproteobacteria bacterium]
MSKPPLKRCAIYTRKSSDEGLDQAFNSLDAQREAGEAYVKSQAGEGWRTLPALYDDGGYSGGTMERPGLRRLLADVDAGLIDVVAVYKIDRLTRSLADFARIVERFDARGISFVSVTQAFNTTSSMGRLTLNVLLSFAQFEREVTGERIRDKIAASKAKGMWMGGIVPLGYDRPADSERVLQVNEIEAETVRAIFARYLELGSVHRLAADITATGMVSKRHVFASGRTSGGGPYSRGALFHLLRNPVYIGRIVHKGTIYPGAHPGIIEPALFEAVQAHLDAQRRRHGSHAERTVIRAPLTGRLFDAAGEAMSPSFSRGARGGTYRYYVSTSLQNGNAKTALTILRRVPAPAIEQLVTDVLGRLLPHEADPLAQLTAVHLRPAGIDLVLPGKLRRSLEGLLAPGEALHPAGRDCIVTVPIDLPLRGGRRSVSGGQRDAAAPDSVLIAALRRAHAMLDRDTAGRPTLASAPASAYERRLLRLALLDPALQCDILAGRQPRRFRLETFLRSEVPLAWDQQRIAFGWSQQPTS